MQEYYYIYGIVNCADRDSLSVKGMDGSVVSFYRYGSYSLVYSIIDSSKLDINYMNLQCHERVLDTLLIDYDVIPFSFSTILLSEGSLDKLCSKYNDVFSESLVKIKGMAEMGLRVISKGTSTEEDALKDMNEKISGYKYMLNIFKEHKDKKKRELEVEEKTRFIQERLEALIKDKKISILPKEGVLLNAAYLIEKSSVPRYMEVLEELQEDCEYTLVASGPWPPYSFVSLES
jgi:hypothetical protein